MAVPIAQSAVVVEKTGGPEVLSYQQYKPIPQPKDGEVLVKNLFSGINYVDTYFRSGLYKSKKPEVLGREGVGHIVALGPGTESSGLKIGDRVAWLGTGGYAQYSVAPVAKTVRVPEKIISHDIAACFLGGLTIVAMLDEAYNVQRDEWVLLHAAAGGVGYLMVQFLKLRGARVIATAGGSAKVEMVRNLGADHVIDYRNTDGEKWTDSVKRLTHGRGVDVVFDSVGKDTWEGSLEVVRRKGTIAWFGNASGPVPPMSLHLLALRCVKVVRPTLGGYIETREEFIQYCEELFRIVESGKLHLKVHKIYPLKETQQAHTDVEGRETTGKLLLGF